MGCGCGKSGSTRVFRVTYSDGRKPDEFKTHPEAQRARATARREGVRASIVTVRR